jgi:hypothetical protein
VSRELDGGLCGPTHGFVHRGSAHTLVGMELRKGEGGDIY